jgi:hypothetical protein
MTAFLFGTRLHYLDLARLVFGIPTVRRYNGLCYGMNRDGSSYLSVPYEQEGIAKEQEVGQQSGVNK